MRSGMPPRGVTLKYKESDAAPGGKWGAELELGPWREVLRGVWGGR